MEIKVGKYYRTRNGQKVGPMCNCLGDFDIESHSDEKLQDTIWRRDGTVWSEDGDESHHYLIAEWTEDDDLNEICDERQDGPFVSASDKPKTWGDDEGWSEWTSYADWDTSKVDVQMECIDGIHRTRTRPRKPVRKTVVAYSGNPSEGHWGPDYDDDDTHRLTFTTTDGKPATGTFTNENGDVIIMEEV